MTAVGAQVRKQLQEDGSSLEDVGLNQIKSASKCVLACKFSSGFLLSAPCSAVNRFVHSVACAVIALLTLVGCSHMNTSQALSLRTVPHVDLDRYLGRWYVIANIPYSLEKGKVASYDTYAKRPDGKLDNIFTFRKGDFAAPEKSWHGVAWVTNPDTNADWKVRFIWPLTSTYLVLELDTDYRWAVVGTPGRKLLWILARERQLSAADYENILDLIAAQGYDRAAIVPVPQPKS